MMTLPECLHSHWFDFVSELCLLEAYAWGAARRADPEAGKAGNVCHQQAGAQPSDLDVFPSKVRGCAVRRVSTRLGRCESVQSSSAVHSVQLPAGGPAAKPYTKLVHLLSMVLCYL